MPRFALVAAALFVSCPVWAQSLATDAALSPRPAAFAADDVLGSVSADTPLTDEQIARRVARLYERQARLLQADADGDQARYTTELDELVTDLNRLAQRPGIMDDARFREVYSSALTEYERFYERPALDRGDIYAFRSAAMQAVEPSFATGTPLLEHVDLPTVDTFPTTIPMDVNAKVERYITFLLNRPNHVNKLRQRSDTYLPMIERVLAEEGVPDELKYLAMVESALVPAARSHAGAAGMWQFIRATGRAYGLKAERDLDDRLDPEKATRAAAQHLRDLYDRFGDWQLALAGYNCNPAVIARAKRRFERENDRPATFWDIDHAIPRETRAYVPMFIATALVVSNPDAYGIDAHEPGPRYVFDRIPVAGGTRLSTVARILDTDEALLRALNPSLRRGRVPNVRVPHMLRIPVGAYTEHQAELDQLAPPEANSRQFAAETVLYGMKSFRPLEPLADSPALLAAAQTASPARPPRPAADRPAARLLAQASALRATPRSSEPEATAPQETDSQEAVTVEPTSAPIAQAETRAPTAPELSAPAPVPAPEAEQATAEATSPVASPMSASLALAEARDLPEPEADTPAPPVAAPPPPAPEPALLAEEASPAPPELTTEPVDDGASIAALIEDAPAAQPAPEPLAAEPAPPIRTTSTASERRRAPQTVHTVQRGEYLLMIARQYGVSIGQLRAWNDLEGTTVHPGQKLRVVAAPATRPASTQRSTVHTVRSGDNLTRIARRYGVTVRQIQSWNNLSSDSIRPGQRLRIERRTVRG
ncbi:MAG: LysM peptidoglycan-binding domain-containing protein [Bacteroidota bacterium]